MTRPVLIAAFVLCGATVALAHSGVQNQAVLERMDAMKAIGDATKTLGRMAKGDMAFDAKAARKAARNIATHAAETPALFEAQEMDPKSEARNAIWEDFDDFAAQAEALEKLAADLSAGIETRDDLRAGMGKLASSCKSCHEEYRE